MALRQHIIASSALLLHSLHIISFATSSPLKPLSLDTTPHPFPQEQCTDSAAWLIPNFNRLDCQMAIDDIWSKEARPRNSQEYEFLLPSVRPKSRTKPLMMTPRKYINGKSDISHEM